MLETSSEATRSSRAERDTFCPLGLSIETEVSPDQDYEVVCHVNGEERQRGSTAEMLFPFPFLIEWLSAWTTLVPGDVILTGSPAGSSRLENGDQVCVSVTGVSTLSHDVVALPASAETATAL